MSSATGCHRCRLTLRITAPGADEQQVTLSDEECTIGSGDDCTLRLDAPGVEPLHCQIVREARGLIVRRHAERTWLNNRPFAAVPLVAGDRLHLGSVEIEVMPATLEPAVAEPNTDYAAAKTNFAPRATSTGRGPGELREQLERQLRQCGAKLAELEGRREEFERNRDEWLVAERAAEAHLAASTEQLSDRLVEVEHRQRLLDARQTELDDATDAFNAERARWAGARREAEEAWLGQCTQWNAEHARFEAEVAEMLARLAARESALAVRERQSLTAKERQKSCDLAPQHAIDTGH